MYNTDLPARAELPSSRQLLRSTAIAFVSASVLLVAAVLPAEYGIDPTGIGRLLGLTKMGEIKTSLAAEAGQGNPALGEGRAAPAAQAQAAAVTAPAAPPPRATPSNKAADAISITLKPGQAAEVKLDMRKGAKVAYRWASSGNGINFDTHGDPPNAPKDFYHGYGKGRDIRQDEGVIEAAFDGKHGWFWRNRSQAEVTITLKTDGEYTAMKRVL